MAFHRKFRVIQKYFFKFSIGIEKSFSLFLSLVSYSKKFLTNFLDPDKYVHVMSFIKNGPLISKNKN